MIELFTNKKDCCGCTACESICPHQAIRMKPDEEGFLYPTIQENLCIECGLCKRVCAFQNGYFTAINFDEPIVYATKHISKDVSDASSSGGMFTAISDEILSNRGVVYGVGFDEKMIACHQRSIDKERRNLLRGSKYVQSEMRQILKEIEIDLKDNITVLFTGTPCQVAATKEYLHRKNVEMDSLVFCDIICHGTPSPLMFFEYLKLCEKKNKKKISNHICRSKINGWHNHTEVNIFKDGQIDYKSYYSQLFKNMFHSHIILRPSCHNCKYTNLSRPSDITIADFWDIDKSIPDFDDDNGVSLVLVNTEKGKCLFKAIEKNIIKRKSNIQDCIQPNLEQPTKPSLKREEFWNEYQKNGFEFVIKKHFGYGLKADTKRFILNTLKKIKLYPLIKKVIG